MIHDVRVQLFLSFLAAFVITGMFAGVQKDIISAILWMQTFFMIHLYLAQKKHEAETKQLNEALALSFQVLGRKIDELKK